MAQPQGRHCFDLEVLSEIEGVETIAVGRAIREFERLKRVYGRGRWRKRKGLATVRLGSGDPFRADLGWMRMARHKSLARYVVCVANQGYRASLIVRRIYRCLPDLSDEDRHMARITDESGEDYLFPQELFVPIALPGAVERAFAAVG